MFDLQNPTRKLKQNVCSFTVFGGMLTKTDHLLGHKISLGKSQECALQTARSDPNNNTEDSSK